MKKTLILIIFLVVIFAAVYFAYGYLSENYTPSASDILSGGGAEVGGETVEVEGVPDKDAADTGNTENTSDPELIEAPDFRVYDGDGNEVHLKDFIGKPIVVNFWATWCPPCKSELPHFEKMFEEYGDEMEFLMVNLTDGGRDTVEGVKKFVADGGYTFPVYYDTEYSAAMTYGTNAIPVTVFIDGNGTLLGGIQGAMDIDTLRECIDITLGKETSK